MATLPELEAAFVKADEAGNTDDAQAFATEIKRMRAAPSKLDQLMDIGTRMETAAPRAFPLVKGLALGGPGGLVVAGGKQALEGIDTISKGVGGAAVDYLASKPMGIDVPAEVSAGVGTALQIGIPYVIGGGVGSRAAPLLKGAGKDLMVAALKGSKIERKAGDVQRAAQTMLDEGVTVTEGGVKVLRQKVGGLNDELQAALNSSPATVDKSAIAARLQDVIAKIETSSFTPQERVKAVEKIYNDALGNAAIPNQIPVALANKIKSGIYKELGDQKYARMRAGTPITDAETANAALARGAKEEISGAVPQAAPLNEKMSGLIRAANMAEDQVLLHQAKNPGGLAWLTHDLPSFIAMMVARHPASKSIIARALYGNADTAATGAGAAAGAAVVAIRKDK